MAYLDKYDIELGSTLSSLIGEYVTGAVRNGEWRVSCACERERAIGARRAQHEAVRWGGGGNAGGERDVNEQAGCISWRLSRPLGTRTHGPLGRKYFCESKRSSCPGALPYG